MSILEDLILEGEKINQEASTIQINTGDSPAGTNWSTNKLDEFRDKYYTWYAKCLTNLSEDLKDKFRFAYESAASIKNFLESPLWEIPAKRGGRRNEKVYPAHWFYSYEKNFHKPFLTQKQILIEASERREAQTIPYKSPKTQANKETTELARELGTIEEQLFDARKFHPEVQLHGRSHFIEQRYFHAVSECSKAYIRYVAKKARSNEDGARLMSSVLSPGKSLRLNPQQTETEKNEQLGLMNLSTGLVFAARNPVQHEPELDYPISQEDALDLLSLISLLYRQIDKTHYVSTL